MPLVLIEVQLIFVIPSIFKDESGVVAPMGFLKSIDVAFRVNAFAPFTVFLNSMAEAFIVRELFIVSGAFIVRFAPCTLLFNVKLSARILSSRKIAISLLFASFPAVPFRVTVPAFIEELETESPIFT